MKVQLSERAIKNYIGNNSKEAEKGLYDAISHISYEGSRCVQNLENMRQWIKKLIDDAIGALNMYRDDCSKKIDSIRFYLQETPPTITITEVKTVEKKNENGETVKEEKEEKKEIPNPYHNQLQAMLAEAENCRKQIENARWECDKHNEKVSALETAAHDFTASVKSAEEFAKGIEDSMREHLKELSAQAKDAHEQLKWAKSACGPFPAIYDDGVIELDGLGNYIRELQNKLNGCSAAANRLVSIADDLGYGWRDEVYKKFYDDASEIRGGVRGIMQELENMNNALDGMYGKLYDYVQTYPDVRYRPTYYRHNYVHMQGMCSKLNGDFKMNI